MTDDLLGHTRPATPEESAVLSRDAGAPPSLLAERYQVLGLLGVGGMGRVYRVHDKALDEIVALKLLRTAAIGADEVLERFRREVKLARLVTSPHVVRTYDLGQHEGELFLTMELVAGRALSGLIEEGPIALDEVLRIARAIAAGIAAAHAAGVLHRDLKPDNVLLGTSGRIAITDFGIARIAANTGSIDHFVGTPSYMAPEQVDASSPLGPPTDVYAVGAILYEMLTGTRPFTGDNAIQIAIARLDKPPPDPRLVRAVPDPIAALVTSCMALDPALRPKDGAALVARLANLTAGAGATLPQPAMPIVPTKSSRSVAVLPLRAPAELADLADGLGEEIVDGLTQTRALRVRPMQSVRSVIKPSADPLEAGRVLEVDVVVECSLRRFGEITRISARAIGVADGFQLSADRIDAKPDELLSAGDAIARAVATALTVELPAVGKRVADPRATALYLEGKSKLAHGWMLGPLEPALGLLQHAHELAPDDPSIAATLACARARYAFFGRPTDLPAVRALAERVVAEVPSDGEAHLALGLACLYAGEMPAAGRALYRAVRCAPGLAGAQSALGAVLLEAGAVEDAIAHLEGALAIDPSSSAALWDLARGYYYQGQRDRTYSLLGGFQGERFYAEITLARFKMWEGERFVGEGRFASTITGDFLRFGELSAKFHATFELTEAEANDLMRLTECANPRLRATRAQFGAEFFAVAGDHDRALLLIERAVDSGLQDQTWMARCPVLAPLRASSRFQRVAALVAARADDVRNAIASA